MQPLNSCVELDCCGASAIVQPCRRTLVNCTTGAVACSSHNECAALDPLFTLRARLQACNFPVQNGVMLSRARVLYFKHNDVADLERVLQKVADEDRRQQ